MHPKSSTPNSQQALLAQVRGQMVTMPDFTDFIEQYLRKLNPNYAESIVAANHIIDR